MINRKQENAARAIDRARRLNPDPQYQLGILHVAHALADDMCSGAERNHFLLVCGVPFTL